ncbi:acetyl/propionyl/methylcrotonyl-CoA carboxylase subunit alpha [Rhodobacteraceae bacterium RKSG542]|uniref:acetyl/propionyl/methylcrotonyl-CoA carboxylase subunit alpha n=1 Tax=Pseudovibrio flavus TaxID=2529854 RepID=UPI003528B50E|nr:acetyl/propionyl/methylcrotonyl-CoA carboxylase subunit alpha [Pseudovibrio flavus]
MFSKILIANRGEIACRIIRSARASGIKTIAVYSDADAGALHVEMADEAYNIGPAPVAESYLKIDRIVEVALQSGAEAIHPGYGFLSENPEFVEAITAAGLTFIGPPASAIRAMGLKDAAKKLMESSGVPVVPGYHGENQDAAFLKEQADQIGYPVLIKARAGGGGKGMRRVDEPASFLAALEGAQREGASSFGDDAVLIEKYISSPRHIEVQVFADSHGNAVHLFERDCSLQRRHQKVIEEAPAPGMSEEMRAAMGDAAVKAALAVGYQGAGTVEFIVDGSDGLRPDRFWFMEMNTRLQVEHPVTEAITGEDLVSWQFSVASSKPLPKRQDELTIKGHSFEARVYAEDAEAGFLPATGTLSKLKLPKNFARVDTGVRAGDTITPFYDPMIAKVIVHAEDREQALIKLTTALEKSYAAGTITNIPFLHRLVQQPDFVAGNMDTLLIDREIDSLCAPTPPSSMVIAIAALVDLGFARKAPASTDPWDTLANWRSWDEARQFSKLAFKGVATTAAVSSKDNNTVTVTLPEEELTMQIIKADETALKVLANGKTSIWRYVEDAGAITVYAAGQNWRIEKNDPLRSEEEGSAAGNAIFAPMPGQVRAINCAVGDEVAEGDTLIITEAMKMEHSLTAPRSGVVSELLATIGDQIEEGALLLSLEEA